MEPTTPPTPTKMIDIPMVSIPAGAFLMGSPKTEADRFDDEGPQHEVKLKAFQMSATTITQAQWRAVAELPKVKQGLDLKTNPSRFKSDDRPIEGVSWLDAMEFCRRLSRQTGKEYTLPTEAQWEYACRAGTTTPFAFGDTLTPEMANFNSDGTTSVGSYPANAWGLFDMHGNVWEWCLDHWHVDYGGAPTDGSAWVDARLGKSSGVVPGSTSRWTAAVLTAPTTSTSPPLLATSSASESSAPSSCRLLRGGSWDNDPMYCRSAIRGHGMAGNVSLNVGFRVACLSQR